MGSLSVAFRAFVRALRDAAFAERVAALLADAPIAPPPSAGQGTAAPPASPAVHASPRSEALILLATLQREGRFVDFIQERLADYSDAQIAAAARDVHRDCQSAIERMFGLKPLLADAEGAQVEAPAGFDAARYRLTGNVAGQPPYRGMLTHHGWMATRCELPSWNGGHDAAFVVAPAEIELR
jgi:hypothetical protein